MGSSYDGVDDSGASVIRRDEDAGKRVCAYGRCADTKALLVVQQEHTVSPCMTRCKVQKETRKRFDQTRSSRREFSSPSLSHIIFLPGASSPFMLSVLSTHVLPTRTHPQVMS